MNLDIQGHENKAYSHDQGMATKYGFPNGDYNDVDSADLKEKPTLPELDVDHKDNQLDEDNLPCKWGPLKSVCCQSCRNPKVVLLLLCCASCVQGMIVNGFISVVISNLERRFDLKSADTGLIASSYDIASLLSLIPVTYFGGLGCKPRWLGFGIILMGLGAFVFSVPHFATGLYAYNTSGDDRFCDADRNSTTSSVCSTSSSSVYDYKYVFILGQLMHGVGAAPLYTLGVTYLDENLTQKMSSIYVGLFYALSIAGPAIGYVLGGYFLTYYTDFDKVDTSLLPITESSVAWVGAWWFGFLIGGTLAIIIGTLLLGFPKFLPNTAKIRAEKVSEAYGGAKAIDTKDTGISSVKDLPKYVKMILTNLTFIFLSLAGASEALVVSGLTTFIPKYLESQFSISSSMAALIVGAATVPAGGGGTFLGGYLVKRLNLKVVGTIKLCVVTCILVLIGTFVFFVKCEDLTFAGINTYYNESRVLSQNELSADCNAECNCPFNYYNPVCGANKVMYFTSCAAGCVNSTKIDGVTTYTNCSCIEANPMTSINPDSLVMATEGKCKSDCNLLPVFITVLVFVIIFTFVTIMPGLSASLRSVPDKQRSFALGVQWIIIRSLGSIPGPIAFGAVIDRTCSFWLNPCGASTDGACYFYDNTKLSYYMLALAIGCKVASVFFYTTAWLLYKPPPEGDEKSNGQNKSPFMSSNNNAMNTGESNEGDVIQGDLSANKSDVDPPVTTCTTEL